ncbi:MAG: hypothetical protein IKU70_13960 [Clostridia bacterium]|nr:hypothetical protein [Clostridia bacterium]
MQKKEWHTALCMLCVLMALAYGLCRFAVYQNQPERLAAFEDRFLDLTTLGISAGEENQLTVSERKVTLSWPDDAQAAEMLTAVQPLPDGCRNLQITLGGGGSMNSWHKERWGYEAWLELRLYKGEEQIASDCAEMPLTASRSDRTRIYTLQAETREADGWQLCAVIRPVDGRIQHGELLLNNWEVDAR